MNASEFTQYHIYQYINKDRSKNYILCLFIINRNHIVWDFEG